MTESDATIAAEMLAAHQRRAAEYRPVILPAMPCDRSRNQQRVGRSSPRRKRANR